MPVSSSSPAARVEHRGVGAHDRVVHAACRAATAARSASIAVRLATSPPRWPPMPSATANSTCSSSTRNASSLLRADEAGVGGRTGGELHRSTSSTVSPTCTRRPCATCVGSCTCSPFTNVPLRRAEVLDPERAVAVEGARVHLRHERVERERHRATAAAAERDLAVDRERGAALRSRARRRTSRHGACGRVARRRRGARRGRGAARVPAPACRAARGRRSRRRAARNR